MKPHLSFHTLLKSRCGLGSLVVKVADKWPACQEFEPSTAEDMQRRSIHVKSVEVQTGRIRSKSTCVNWVVDWILTVDLALGVGILRAISISYGDDARRFESDSIQCWDRSSRFALAKE
ncbi:hypothetical protein TNCV_1716911 [Trichonephila clavipes]|nr:hypothetical protein TNCV_1716911 [Trichonephila clavipes]